MRRKVVKQGPSTMMVSLPKTWLKRCRLSKGDELEVTELGSRLIISKDTRNQNLRAKVEVNDSRYIRSIIGRYYKAGYSQIEIIYKSPELFTFVKAAVNNIIGAEIIEIQSHMCLIQILPIESCASKIENDLVKMLITLKTMLSIIKEDCKKGIYNNALVVTEMRDNNWKVNDLIIRTLVLKNSEPYYMFNITNATFCYEKIGTKISGFYRRYLSKKKQAQNIDERVEALLVFIDTFIKFISAKSITPKEEATFRNQILAYNVSIFEELAKGRGVDQAYLSMVYIVAELLDSSTSYIFSHKNRLGEMSALGSV